MTFSEKTTPLHLPIQNILLAVNPFYCFFAKSQWAGKKSMFVHASLFNQKKPQITFACQSPTLPTITILLSFVRVLSLTPPLLVLDKVKLSDRHAKTLHIFMLELSLVLLRSSLYILSISSAFS